MTFARYRELWNLSIHNDWRIAFPAKLRLLGVNSLVGLALWIGFVIGTYL